MSSLMKTITLGMVVGEAVMMNQRCSLMVKDI